MKIAQVSTVHRADDVRIYHKMAGALDAAGHDVVVIALEPGGPVSSNIRILPSERYRALRMTRGVWRALRAIRRFGADAAQLHDPELLVLVPLLRLLGIKVVADLHEDLSAQIGDKYWIPRLLRRVVAAAMRVTYRLLLPLADAVVVAAPALAETYARYDPVLIANYPRRNDVTADRSARTPARRAVYVGGLSERRGLREMVAAVSRIPNATLALAGRFEPPDLEREAASWAGWERVEFHGWLERPAVRALLSDSDVGLAVLYPTRQHLGSRPIKLFEYMAAGLPVVASAFPGWEEIIAGHGCGVAVDPRNVDAIAAAVEGLFADPETAGAMGRRGQHAVTTEYSWETQERRLHELYETLA